MSVVSNSVFYESVDVGDDDDPFTSPLQPRRRRFLIPVLQEIDQNRLRQQAEDAFVSFSCSRDYDDEDEDDMKERRRRKGGARSGNSTFDNSDDFVVVSNTNLALWTDIFIRNFINVTGASVKNVAESDDANDDLLFFVKKSMSARLQRRFLPGSNNLIEVYRKDSKKLPVGNVDVDWEETVYLNVILQSFLYTLTLGILSRTGSSSVQILQKQSVKVYASPSSRCMHEGKGEQEVISFPDIFFTVDNFEDALLDKLTVKDGESLCIELTARDKKKRDLESTVLFSGCIQYDPLRSSAETILKPGTRMSFKNFTNSYNNASHHHTQSRGRHGNMAFVKIRSSSQRMNAEVAVKRNRSESSCPATPTGDEDYDVISLGAYNGLQPIVVFTGYLDHIKYYLSSCVYFCCYSLLLVPRIIYVSCHPPERTTSSAQTSPKSRKHKQRDDLRQLRNRRTSDPASYFTDFMELKSIAKCKSESDLGEREVEITSLSEELSTQQDMWSLPTFGQSFFSWKNSKRQSCIPLHVAVTYIAMKFDQIIHLLLTNDQKPVLTF